jgi:drug/metabolite transporter (DMT)-like permease
MLGELEALGAALCVALAAAIYKDALLDSGIGEVPANFIRCVPATCFLLILTVSLGDLAPVQSIDYSSWVLIALGAVIGMGVGDCLYFRVLRCIGVAVGVPVTSIYPLFTILIASFILKEPISILVIAGALLIILGIWLITCPGNKRTENIKAGVWIGVAVAALWSISIVLFKVALGSVSPLITNTLRLLILTPLLGAAVFARPTWRKTMKNARSWLAFGVAGILALAIGGLLFFRSMCSIGAARSTPLYAVTPLFALLIGVVFLKESLERKQIVGIFVMFLGILAVTIG